MNLNRFIELMKSLYNDENLTSKNKKDLDNYATVLLDAMEKEEIDYDSQNALDTYIEFYEGMDSITSQTNNNIKRYNQILEKRRLQKEKENKQSASLKIKPIDKKRLDNTGAIKTISIIEIVTVLGIFIAVLILALALK